LINLVKSTVSREYIFIKKVVSGLKLLYISKKM